MLQPQLHSHAQVDTYSFDFSPLPMTVHLSLEPSFVWLKPSARCDMAARLPTAKADAPLIKRAATTPAFNSHYNGTMP
ncbi:MAG: hypothetical protein Q4A11_06570 [Brachymonas sp.]|nr:hypothetical protein [Brachymonas sp.]